ncbi:MAG: site-specific DNA-methyltransferase, partial [Acidobacteria bacterium]|nr:site-specific DNA-methyltransferase [Acidobacteriota bacterium]
LTSAGLDYVRTGAWIKVGSTPQFSGDRPATGFEAITIAHQPGRKRWNGGGSHAVWSVPIVLVRGKTKERFHPTQKPQGLMQLLVGQFTDPGDTILDPFSGSGTTLIAARMLERRAIGIELDERHCESVAKRLEQGVFVGVA